MRTELKHWLKIEKHVYKLEKTAFGPQTVLNCQK